MKTPRFTSTAIDFRQVGYLAYVIAGKRLPVTVMQSQAGWYVGTIDEQGLPCSRESSEYWMTEEAARIAFANRSWTQKQNP